MKKILYGNIYERNLKIFTSTGQLAKAIESDGCSMAILKVAFKAGSSKHGLKIINQIQKLY
jgi:hypothetical protein